MEVNKVKSVILFSVFLLGSMISSVSMATLASTPPLPLSSIADVKHQLPLLVSPEWLSHHYADQQILLLDTRDYKDYAKGHIPGAVHVKWQDFADVAGALNNGHWGTVLPREKLAKRFNQLGMTAEKQIIVYDNNKQGWGADGRFVWMLNLVGFTHASLLDGGIEHWKTLNFPLEKKVMTPYQKGNISFTGFNSKITISTKELYDTLDKIKVIDTRSQSEFAGAIKYGEARGGHLPGAIHFDFHQLFADDATLKSQQEIETMLRQAGIKKSDHIVAYCTVGIRSAYMTVILSHYGYAIKNYMEGFYGWAASPYPVEK